MKNTSIDEIDKKILELLQDNGKLSYAEIGEKVFVSPGTVHLRVKKMQQSGVIVKHQVLVNHLLIGYDIKCFLGIFLETSNWYDSVLEELKKIPEIVSVDYTTGNYSMFLTMYCRDTNHLKMVLHDKIQKIKGISRTETIISLSEDIKRSTSLTPS